MVNQLLIPLPGRLRPAKEGRLIDPTLLEQLRPSLQPGEIPLAAFAGRVYYQDGPHAQGFLGLTERHVIFGAYLGPDSTPPYECSALPYRQILSLTLKVDERASRLSVHSAVERFAVTMPGDQAAEAYRQMLARLP